MTSETESSLALALRAGVEGRLSPMTAVQGRKREATTTLCERRELEDILVGKEREGRGRRRKTEIYEQNSGELIDYVVRQNNYRNYGFLDREAMRPHGAPQVRQLPRLAGKTGHVRKYSSLL